MSRLTVEADSPAVGAEELGERRGEVAGREPAQVQDRQHLGDLGRLAHVGRQDRRGEVLALAAVVDPRGAAPRPCRRRSSPPGTGRSRCRPPGACRWRRARRRWPRGRPGARPAAPRPASPGRPPGTARRGRSSRASGSSTAVAVASWTSFNIGVSLPAGFIRRTRCLVNLEGTSRPSSDRASTTSGYNSSPETAIFYLGQIAKTLVRRQGPMHRLPTRRSIVAGADFERQTTQL